VDLLLVVRWRQALLGSAGNDREAGTIKCRECGGMFGRLFGRS
jgi:hypothetical protein